MTTILKVGDRIRDNDPRMGDRLLTITHLYPYGVDAIAHTSKRQVRILTKRIFADGKARRYGYNVIASAGQ